MKEKLDKLIFFIIYAGSRTVFGIVVIISAFIPSLILYFIVNFILNSFGIYTEWVLILSIAYGFYLLMSNTRKYARNRFIGFKEHIRKSISFAIEDITENKNGNIIIKKDELYMKINEAIQKEEETFLKQNFLTRKSKVQNKLFNLYYD